MNAVLFHQLVWRDMPIRLKPPVLFACLLANDNLEQASSILSSVIALPNVGHQQHVFRRSKLFVTYTISSTLRPIGVTASLMRLMDLHDCLCIPNGIITRQLWRTNRHRHDFLASAYCRFYLFRY